MKKIALYCRVSSEKQEEERTIQSQVAELQDFCKDFQIVKTYLDDGWSGGLLDRPGLDQLRLDAKEKMFEAVHVHAVDRISRNLYHQTIIVEELKKSEVEIFIKDKPIADTPDGRFMFNILGAVAEYEKEKILERTRRGRIYKAKNKGFVGYMGAYGYDYVKKDSSGKDGHFEVNKKEAEIVGLIFALYSEFQSLHQVQQELTKREILPRKAKFWCRSTIRQILRNESYTGNGFYNKRQSVVRENGKKYNRKIKNGIKIRPKAEWIPVNFPQILDKPKFDIAQEILSKKFRPFGQSKYFYLLSNLITCSHCGSTFTGAGNGRHPYYRCSDRRRKLPLSQDCHVSHMRTEDLDEAIWKSVSEAATDRKILASYISQLADEIVEDKSLMQNQKDGILSSLISVKGKKDKLLEIYTEGGVDKDRFTRKMGEYSNEENKLNEELASLELRTNKGFQKPQIMENLKHFCQMARQEIKNLSNQEKQQFLRKILIEVILDSDTGDATVIGRVPVNNQSIDDFSPLESRPSYIVSKVYASPSRMETLPLREQNIMSVIRHDLCL